MRTLALLLAALAAAPITARAQAAAASPAPRDTVADRQAALGVVKALFDAMRAADSAKARTLFHPKAQLATAVVDRAGEPVVQVETVDGLVKAFGGAKPGMLDERTFNERVLLDGPLAVVWTDYSLFVNERFSHCGIDVFQIAQTKDGWTIVALADTRRRQGCKDAPPAPPR